MNEVINRTLVQMDRRRQHPRGEKQRFPYGCEKCDGYGNFINELGARTCECKLNYLFGPALHAAGVPEKYMNATLDNFNTEAFHSRLLHTWAREYLEKFSEGTREKRSKGALLMGRPGTGKTHIVVAFLRSVFWNHYIHPPCHFHCAFHSAGELLDDIRSTYDESSECTEARILKGLYEVDLLVLDDLAADDRLTAYAVERFNRINDQRYNDEKPTVITTNRSLAELKRIFGERFVSRVLEGYEIVDLLNCPTEDFRANAVDVYRVEAFSAEGSLERKT